MTSVQNPFNSPEFRKELSDLLDEKLSPILTKVAEHEKDIQRAHGASWAFRGVGAVILGVAEWLLHRK